MKAKNEELLSAWLRLSVIVSNDRLTSDMPYNEALICNILYGSYLNGNTEGLTATELCHHSRILKSQMNRTLQSMEEKNLIKRQRSAADRRQVYISLNSDCQLYQKQHAKILNLVDAVMKKLGEEQTDETIKILTNIANIADEVMK